MSDRRIRIAKDMADLVDALCSADDHAAPFKLRVDVLAFAAALGARHGTRVEFSDATKEPIRHEVFARQNYDTLINLLAVYETRDAKVLANSDDMENLRATIFEEFANGGLHVLRGQIKGARSTLDALLLVVQKERTSIAGDHDDLDLAQFLT